MPARSPPRFTRTGGWKEATGRAIAAVRSSSAALLVASAALLLLLLLFVFSSLGRIDHGPIYHANTSKRPNAPISRFDNEDSFERITEPVTINCPRNQTSIPVCQRSGPSLTSAVRLTTTQTSSCPEYFRWIHEDLRHWKSTGITKEMVEKAKKFATFRLVVLDGRVYVEEYLGHGMTRNVFTLWGILQLINRYPGRVPDLDLVFNCMDLPSVKPADSGSAPPPPLFHYCKDSGTLDILFPDWSFWGWPETNVKAWEPLITEIKEGNEKANWKDRLPYAFWKGNPGMGGNRMDLMKCNASNGKDWNAHLYTQEWHVESREGFKQSNLAGQCHHRYKIYIEGFAWSVSRKYIQACDSPSLVVNPRYDEFFTRGMFPGEHYWPINVKNKCRSVKFAVEWGNNHPKKAQDMGKAGSAFIREDVKMDYVYDYMLHVLNEYAKLLKYKPTVPKNAIELCLESMACNAPRDQKEFLLESMVKQRDNAEPCKMPLQFRPDELQELLEKKASSIRQVEMWEETAKGDT